MKRMCRCGCADVTTTDFVDVKFRGLYIFVHGLYHCFDLSPRRG